MARRCGAPGGGRRYELAARDRLLLAVVWLRRYPTNQVLGYLFGVSEPTARRAVGRVVPLLEADGRDGMRLPDPGKGRRRALDALLADTPGLALLIDTFEQRVQRGDVLLVAARVKAACVHAHTYKPAPLPERLREQLQR